MMDDEAWADYVDMVKVAHPAGKGIQPSAEVQEHERRQS